MTQPQKTQPQKTRKPVKRQYGAPNNVTDFRRPDYAPIRPSLVSWWRDPFTWIVIGGIIGGIAATWIFVYFMEVYGGR